MLNIANQQGNANQSHNELSPQTCQNGYRDCNVFGTIFVIHILECDHLIFSGNFILSSANSQPSPSDALTILPKLLYISFVLLATFLKMFCQSCLLFSFSFSFLLCSHRLFFCFVQMFAHNEYQTLFNDMSSFMTCYQQDICINAWRSQCSRQKCLCLNDLFQPFIFYKPTVCQPQRCSPFRDSINNRLARNCIFLQYPNCP